LWTYLVELAWGDTVAICCLLVVHSDNVEVIEPFCDFAQLVLVLLVVKGSPDRFDGLVALGSAILWHKKRLVWMLLLHIVKRLALDYFFLQQ